jgi:hypothetical protein
MSGRGGGARTGTRIGGAQKGSKGSSQLLYDVRCTRSPDMYSSLWGYTPDHIRERGTSRRPPNSLAPSEEDPKGWSTVLITALGSWEKPVLLLINPLKCKLHMITEPASLLLI